MRTSEGQRRRGLPQGADVLRPAGVQHGTRARPGRRPSISCRCSTATIRSSRRRVPAPPWSSTATRPVPYRSGHACEGRTYGGTDLRAEPVPCPRPSRSRVGTRRKGTVTYHSSCHLARDLGVRDEPSPVAVDEGVGSSRCPTPRGAAGSGGCSWRASRELVCAGGREGGFHPGDGAER